MPGFITNIEIKSFRGIQDLKIDKLAQINILTGDNNCGKTSILEVINSYGQPDDFRLWRNLLRKDIKRIKGISYYEGFYDLFNINDEIKKAEYTIETLEKHTNVVLKALETEEELSEEEYNKMQGLSYVKMEEDGVVDDSVQTVPRLDIAIRVNGRTVNKRSIYEGQIRWPLILKKVLNQYSENVVYISPFRHVEGDIFLNDILDNPELYEQILVILKEFDEEIISLNYDNDGTGKGGYKILSRSHEKALPLNMYGDGMKKALLLMSAVLKAKDGILLLDEFETAIHTSAMNKTFKWILETCLKLNVQVFLTSHSKEAIDKVLKCSPDIQQNTVVYTLYKDREGSSVRRLPAKKAVEVQDEMGLELR